MNKHVGTDHVGTWALVRGEAVDEDGNPAEQPFGGEYVIGRVVLTADGRMSAAITDARTVIPEGETRRYSCYAGPYTFDGKTLITTVDNCSDPARMGTQQVRDVSFDGDLMVLRPPLRDMGGKRPVYATIWWKKLSDE